MHIESVKDGTPWIDIRYEKLLNLCFKCGIIRHNEEYCMRTYQNSTDPNAKNSFGPWLR